MFPCTFGKSASLVAVIFAHAPEGHPLRLIPLPVFQFRWEWSFINNALELFNFGASIRKWFSVFYNGGETAVMNAGYTTNYFKISRGVRQGCPLSPFLFILADELLASKIRQLQDCKGIPLPNHEEVKISQFADDTSHIYRSTNS